VPQPQGQLKPKGWDSPSTWGSRPLGLQPRNTSKDSALSPLCWLIQEFRNGAPSPVRAWKATRPGRPAPASGHAPSPHGHLHECPLPPSLPVMASVSLTMRQPRALMVLPELVPLPTDLSCIWIQPGAGPTGGRGHQARLCSQSGGLSQGRSQVDQPWVSRASVRFGSTGHPCVCPSELQSQVPIKASPTPCRDRQLHGPHTHPPGWAETSDLKSPPSCPCV
jgi:hypothetical protein